jgi:ribosomal protein L11 methyltransferase
MFWWQISLQCQAADLEQVETLMLDMGALSISLADAGDEPIYEPLPGDQPVWSESIVTGTFDAALDPEDLQQKLGAALPAAIRASLRHDRLQEQDWELAYRAHFEPMQFGDRLWVVPSWCEPPETAAAVITLDPGMAFGTGSHATTSLCLDWLAEQSLEDSDVIDFGCGSGILAIAACKLGARRVRAVDIDTQALGATGANARVNEIDAHRIEIGTPEAMDTRPADILLANILAEPLIALAPRIAELVRPGGRIMLSGILKTQLEALQSVYRSRFKLDPARCRGEWLGISATRFDHK